MSILRFLILLVIFSFNITIIAENKYPLTREEEQNKRIGSIFGKKGLVFELNPKAKKEVVNDALWQAIIKEIDFIGIEDSSYEHGTINSKFYYPQKNLRYKFNIKLEPGKLMAEAVNLDILKEKKLNNKWYRQAVDAKIITEIEKEFLYKARLILVEQQANLEE